MRYIDSTVDRAIAVHGPAQNDGNQYPVSHSVNVKLYFPKRNGRDSSSKEISFTMNYRLKPEV